MNWERASDAAHSEGEEEGETFNDQDPRHLRDTQITWYHWFHGQKDGKKQGRETSHDWKVTGEGRGCAVQAMENRELSSAGMSLVLLVTVGSELQQKRIYIRSNKPKDNV